MLRKLDHKYRFQLLAEFIAANYRPSKVADVGGSKGMLAYLLNKKGFETEVIDPAQSQPIYKYKDYLTGKRTLITPAEAKSIKRRVKHFEPEMAKDFDLLVGLHAHGCNLKIIEAAVKYHKNFVLLPCCVIDEPIEVRPDVDWFESLFEAAKNQGQKVEKSEINFKGQNKIIFSNG